MDRKRSVYLKDVESILYNMQQVPAEAYRSNGYIQCPSQMPVGCCRVIAHSVEHLLPHNHQKSLQRPHIKRAVQRGTASKRRTSPSTKAKSLPRKPSPRLRAINSTLAAGSSASRTNGSWSWLLDAAESLHSLLSISSHTTMTRSLFSLSFQRVYSPLNDVSNASSNCVFRVSEMPLLPTTASTSSPNDDAKARLSCPLIAGGLMMGMRQRRQLLSRLWKPSAVPQPTPNPIAYRSVYLCNRLIQIAPKAHRQKPEAGLENEDEAFRDTAPNAVHPRQKS